MPQSKGNGQAGANQNTGGAAGGQSGSQTGGTGDAGAGQAAAQGAAGGGNAGGAGDALFGDGGNNSNGGAAAGNGNAANQGGQAANGTGKLVLPDNWKDALPDELKNDGSLGPIKTVEMLVKSYVNAQKLIGADKVPVPGKHASTEDWKETMHKLGNPRTIEEYKFELEKDTEVDAPFLEGFKKEAHQAGILPAQAKKMVDWFSKVNKDSWAAVSTEQENALVEGMTALKKEWGAAVDDNMLKARVAVKELAGGDEKLLKFFQDSGLGKNANFVKLMSAAGGLLAEDKLRGGGQGGGLNGALSPVIAKSKIAEITANPKHAYWNPNHENHMAAKKEVEGLYQMANAKSS